LRILAALLLLVPSLALAIPAQIAAEYQVTHKGMVIGRVHETFHREAGAYSIRSVTRSEGLLKIFYDEQITLESRGAVDGAGLRPERFREERVRDPKRNVEATFDWKRGVLRSRFRGEEKEIALPARTQDRLSMMYQFVYGAGDGRERVLSMSNGRKVEQYRYRLVDQPRIATPAGEFDTLHFERVRQKEGDSRVEVWLAPERDHFPVRVVYDDPDGLRVEQSLVALRAR
jgi:hypothetical protein